MIFRWQYRDYIHMSPPWTTADRGNTSKMATTEHLIETKGNDKWIYQFLLRLSHGFVLEIVH